MKNATRSNIYVCGNPCGFDEFTPVAVVLEKTENTVTFERYMKLTEDYDEDSFGGLICDE